MIPEPVTREHREAAAQLTYWPGAWKHRQVLDWCATGAINDGVSPKMAIVAGALAEAERRGRVSAEPRWISCSERTPDDCALVLIRKPDWGGYCETATWGEENKHWVASEYGPYEAAEVSHWMPLPNPPEAPQPTKET